MSLAQLEQWLQEHLPEAASSLSAPASDGVWDSFAAESGIALPPQFVELYRWHDGQSRACMTGIFFGLRFMPAVEAITEWRYWAAEAKSAPASRVSNEDLFVRVSKLSKL